MAELEASKLFADVAPDEFEKLATHVEERSFEKDGIIFKEGDSGDGVYVIKSGRVAITVLMSDQDRRTLAHIEPGDFFGEMAVLDSGNRSATAVADEATLLDFIPRDAILSLLERSPKFALSMIREFSLRIREFNRKYIEEALQAERLMLVGRFARSIVHDFKNPLNVIRIASEMAAEQSTTIEKRGLYRNRICKQVDRLSNMINELLEFTRGSQTTVIMAPTNYAVFVHQLIVDLEIEVRDRGIDLQLENEPPDIQVLFEPQRLSHVFYNLINNAVDEMPDGGRITLRFGIENGYLVTEIEDSGKGIDPEIAPKLFEAFATHGKKQGTGLGLSICKKIITDHRGDISARSAPSGGAIFSFSLALPREGDQPATP